MVSTSLGVALPLMPILRSPIVRLAFAILPASAFWSSVLEKFPRPLMPITSSNVVKFAKSFKP